MLKRWSVTNFKPIRGRLDLDLAPVTLLAGLNSCGKSSFLQSILLVQQTLANQNRKTTLAFNGLSISLGKYEEIVNDRAEDEPLGIGFDLLIENESRENYPHAIRIDAAFERSDSFQANVAGARIDLISKKGGSKFQYSQSMNSDQFVVKEMSVPDVLVLIEKDHFLPSLHITFGKEKDKSLRVPQLLVDTFASLVRYIGPLRADPATIHSSPTGEPDDVGKQGEHAAAVYKARQALPIQWLPPGESEIQENTLEEAVAVWLRFLGMARGVTSQQAARGFTWMVKTQRDKSRPLFSVGVGVSQVLPILVAGLLAPGGAVLIIEQPELHLHPRAQARMGDFFISLARLGKQCLIETHSDTLVNQLRLHMVKGGEATRELVKIYFAEQDDLGDTRFEAIKVSEGGNIVNWPEGFLDEGVKQEEAIAQEALRKRSPRSRSGA